MTWRTRGEKRAVVLFESQAEKTVLKCCLWGNKILPLSPSVWVTSRCPDPVPFPPPLEEMTIMTIIKLLRCPRLDILWELLHQVPQRRHDPHFVDEETG